MKKYKLFRFLHQIFQEAFGDIVPTIFICMLLFLMISSFYFVCGYIYVTLLGHAPFNPKSFAPVLETGTLIGTATIIMMLVLLGVYNIFCDFKKIWDKS